MKEKKEVLEARLNELGRRWSALELEGNEAVKKDLEIQIFSLSFDWLTQDQKNLEDRANSYALSDALGKFYEYDWKKYSAAKGELSKYFLARLKYRLKDIKNKDTSGHWKTVLEETPDGEKKKKVWISQGSLDVPLPGIEDADETVADVLRDTNAQIPIQNIESEGLLADLLSLVLTMPTRLQGRSNNPDRIHYFRLFFTDGLESFLYQVKTGEELSRYVRHEKDVLNAIILPFLDFFKTKPCRTVKEISMVPVKRYEDMVENRVGKTLGKRPLPNDVYMTYFQEVEGKRRGDSAISQQRKVYREFLKENLGC